MVDLKTEQRKLQTTFRLHLNRLHNQFRDKELALMMGMTVSQADLVRKMRAGDATIQPCRIIELSKNLVREYSDCSLLQEMVPDEGYTAYAVKSGSANGTITDEIVQINKFSGLIIEESEKENPDSQKIITYAKQIAGQSGTIEQEMT